ncbi:hypothetical protein WJX75_008252 [Coccomyxa subellipsoidea]|uniref:Uncharacterized protein n=1 Tax=Coccomyxa subellipsoidea TaxID=248742 RepID=A0ABR2YW95_9CHLO
MQIRRECRGLRSTWSSPGRSQRTQSPVPAPAVRAQDTSHARGATLQEPCGLGSTFSALWSLAASPAPSAVARAASLVSTAKGQDTGQAG